MAVCDYRISVRELCEFTAKAGDLDLRFTPSPSALEGVALHQVVARRRRTEFAERYVSELVLTGVYDSLQVQGRADGWLPERARLEEVKSFRGRLDKMPDNQRALHWAQLKIYGYLLCQQLGLAELTLALIYIDAGDETEHPVIEYWSAKDLQAFWQHQCQIFLNWARAELAHRQCRHAALAALPFPFAELHAGQRQLAETMYKAVKRERCILAEAPTGTGKTLASLFSVLKAAETLDKVFFLCAKTPGRALALGGLRQLQAPNLRVLELIAKDKACEHPDLACHGDSCPLARGFYDRLPAARQAAVAATWLDASKVRDVARGHSICPYFLSQELARWADVLVADYNYYFDKTALLHSLMQANRWRVAVLVDEAHNLIDRARAMYSANLTRAQGAAAKKVAPKILRPAMARLERAWQALVKPLAPEQRHLLTALPAAFGGALNALIADCGRWQAERGEPMPEALQQFYFACVQLLKISELADDVYIVDVEKTGRGQAALNFRNVIPAPWLAPRFNDSVASLLFSATLQPFSYPLALLGLPADTVSVQVASPFNASQLQVRVARHISTRFNDRRASLPALVALVLQQYQARAGNYLVFFSSFAYLTLAHTALVQAIDAAGIDLSIWCQARGMGEAARTEFVNRFKSGGQGLGLAVLGGAFGEGIDLPGDRLVGAFIATLGMPQFNPVNEDFRARIDAHLGDGYNRVYLYPGLQKVVQAAGRIIRTTDDRGVLFLLDDRFARPAVQALLPDWWQLQG